MKLHIPFIIVAALSAWLTSVCIEWLVEESAWSECKAQQGAELRRILKEMKR